VHQFVGLVGAELYGLLCEVLALRGHTNTPGPYNRLDGRSRNLRGGKRILMMAELKDDSDKVNEWYRRLTGALLKLPDDQRAELAEWQKLNVNYCTVFVSDWPGWTSIIGPRPDIGSDSRNKFRDLRLESISEHSTQIKLWNSPIIVAHVMPEHDYDVNLLENHDPNVIGNELLVMLSRQGREYSNRRTTDSHIKHAPKEEPYYTYTELFNNGRIEIAREAYYTNPPSIDTDYEYELLTVLQSALKVQFDIGVRGRIYVALSILGAEGCRMRRKDNILVNSLAISGQEVRTPETFIEELGQHDIADLARVMKKSFDYIARAAGLRGSVNYDSNRVFLDRFR